MTEVAGRVFDYLGYKNKISAAEWAERLWQQHLKGAPADFRPDEDRQRYVELAARLEQCRSLAHKLHARRAAHAPFARRPAVAAPPEPDAGRPQNAVAAM